MLTRRGFRRSKFSCFKQHYFVAGVSWGLTTNLHANMCSGLFELTAFYKQRKIAVIHNQSSLKQAINYSIAEKLYLV